MVKMGTAGLSGTRLRRMHEIMAGYTERGDIPGIVTAISRRGEAHVDALGIHTVGESTPMRRDSIFRIASLSKSVTAVAAMVLVEECRLRLDDPVDRWLPELADRQVLARIDGPTAETVPAARPISLRDLLTLRMGFGFVMSPNWDWPIQQAMAEHGCAVGPNPVKVPADEWLKNLGSLPLMHQPGTAFLYDTAFDVLGVLISRVAGQSLGSFFQEHIFGPLGMKDTGFSVPVDQQHRLPTCYQSDSEQSGLEVWDAAEGGKWASPPVFESARGGLVSTADDFLTFGQMLLNFGRLGNERILARPTVEAMRTNQLTPEQRAGGEMFLGNNRGWGLGVSMVVERSEPAAVPGRFGWDGGYGTSWGADPAEDMVVLLLTQRLWDTPTPPAVLSHFWSGAYAAIDD
jgi:CubicO group peptidase (beta-lactamase class C family)